MLRIAKVITIYHMRQTENSKFQGPVAAEIFLSGPDDSMVKLLVIQYEIN